MSVQTSSPAATRCRADSLICCVFVLLLLKLLFFRALFTYSIVVFVLKRSWGAFALNVELLLM